ncbi:cytochrome P450 [Microbacterium hominis]|uniref:Cytochrome P450 n=1 Tax=Microbacterium hominis TaxID=162426 RepID=A0A7D4Q2T1_9MICO|nr:cytochrome P450 [Microbacterium hominis]QKJ20532.1 cytochrome P450 [Microbacterium hominis]
MSAIIGTEDDVLLTRPEFWARPDRHEVFKHFRDEAPVTFHPEVAAPWAPEGGPGFWAVMRYQDVQDVTRNTKVYSNKFGTQPEEWPQTRVAALGMLHMDDPEHRIWRQMVGPAFAPRYLDSMLDTIRRNANEVIDALVAQPDVDVVSTLVNRYPVKIIADMLAMPKEDHEQFVEWTYYAFGPDRVKGNAAHHALIEYGVNLAASRRQNIGDDVMSRIVTAEYEGRLLTDIEVGGFVSLLIGAGAETTGSSIATGLWQLGKNPDQWELLKNDPSLINKAVDEFCRYTSAVVNFRRTALEDVELGGQKIKAGDKVVLYYESANFDETVFSDPETFDITRDSSKQVAFGAGGPHQCLGEHLGRREMKVFLEELIKRVDDITVTADLLRPPNPRFNMIQQFRATFAEK